MTALYPSMRWGDVCGQGNHSVGRRCSRHSCAYPPNDRPPPQPPLDRALTRPPKPPRETTELRVWIRWVVTGVVIALLPTL